MIGKDKETELEKVDCTKGNNQNKRFTKIMGLSNGGAKRCIVVFDRDN